MKTLRVTILLALLLALFVLPGRAAAQPIHPLPLGDDKVLFGGDFTLFSGEELDGDLISFGGNVTLEVDSVVLGNVVSMGGNVDSAGEIEGDLISFGSNITLTDTSLVGGDLAAIGSNVERASGAEVMGDTVTETNWNFQVPDVPRFQDGFDLSRDRNLNYQFGSFGRSVADQVIWGLFRALGMAALAVIVTLFLPAHTRRTADTILAQPVASGGLGLASIVVLPVLTVLMAITILLIPVLALLLFIVVLAAAFGWVAVGLEVGERLVAAMNVDWEAPIQAGVGTLVLTFSLSIVGLVPCIGWLAGFLVFLLSFGAVLLTRFGTQAYPAVETGVVEAEPKKPAPKKAAPKKKSS